MPVTRTLTTAVSTGANRQVFETIDVSTPDVGFGHSWALVGVLTETVGVASFTDGGAEVGTYQMIGSLPVGAVVLLTKIGPVTGFTGDTSAAITIGDGSDVDRYHTGTPSVFATDAIGVECGVPSGAVLLTAANHPILTITSDADFTAVDAGSVTVSIYFIQV